MGQQRSLYRNQLWRKPPLENFIIKVCFFVIYIFAYLFIFTGCLLVDMTLNSMLLFLFSRKTRNSSLKLRNQQEQEELNISFFCFSRLIWHEQHWWEDLYHKSKTNKHSLFILLIWITEYILKSEEMTIIVTSFKVKFAYSSIIIG